MIFIRNSSHSLLLTALLSLLLSVLVGCGNTSNDESVASIAEQATAVPTETSTLPPITIIVSTNTTVPPTATQTATATPSATATATAVPPSPTPSLTPTITPEPIVHLAAVGDIMLDRALGNIVASGNITYPFAAVSDWLTQPDITVGNLETALGSRGEPYPEKIYTFQAPPEAADSLAVAGFDVISLANNHAMDYGAESLLDGITLLKERGIAPIGAGQNRTEARTPHITTINGVSLAFLAYVQVSPEFGGFDVEVWNATADSPGMAWARPDEVKAEVAAVAPLVDHVIVVLHSGIEYLPPPSEEQQALVDAALAGGASLILGHHAHILQGIRYDETAQTLVAYGLGNFAFDIDGDPDTAVLHVWLSPDGILDIELLPAVIQVGGAPRPAIGQEATAILQKVGRQSRGWQP